MPRKKEIKEFQLVREWAAERGLYDFGDVKTQTIKMVEELGEFSRALLKQDKVEMIDALGDMQVVLVNLAKLSGIRLEDALASAYNVIKDRNGNMVAGTFVKDVEEIDEINTHSVKFPDDIMERIQRGAPFDEKLPGQMINCTVCGIDLSKVTGYVCGNNDCPHQMKVT